MLKLAGVAQVDFNPLKVEVEHLKDNPYKQDDDKLQATRYSVRFVSQYFLGNL